jgi:3',5'-cyclic AMP phosphodiesterase CpdA
MAGTSPAMTDNMFTLAHLSDPHLAPLPAPHWTELLNKRLTGYINWQRRRRFIHDAGVLAKIVADLKAQQADHIACTGDLANIALPEEFARGRVWLERLGDPQHVSLVPGNHDAYVRGALVDAARAWGPYMFGDDAAGFPYLRRRGPLALIGLSTAVPTAPGLATGRLGTRQLAALAPLLANLKHENLFRIVLIHHPPVSAAHWHKLLLDADALKRVIAEHGADLLLHGHDHLAMVNWLAGPNGTRVPAVGVPSASAAPGIAKNAAGYNLYRVDGSPGAWRCEMISRGIATNGDVTEQKRVTLMG